MDEQKEENLTALEIMGEIKKCNEELGICSNKIKVIGERASYLEDLLISL